VVFLAKALPLLRSLNDLSPLLLNLHMQYGPIISIRLIFRTFIFVADRGIAHRMLVHSGATFSSRPPTFEPRHLFTSGETTFCPYGHYWRLVRRNLATGELLNPARVRLLAPVRQAVCDDLIHDLRAACSVDGAVNSVEAVVELRPLLRRALLKLLVHKCFGVHLGREELDEIHDLQRQMLHSLATFPILGFFPALTKKLFRNQWAACVAVRRRQEELFVPMIHATLGSNGETPCYARSLLDVRVPEDKNGHGGDRPLTDGEMTSLCNELINAAGDTTGTLIEWIMAELVSHPDIQANVYEEVKACAQLNDDTDLEAMPYLKAIVLEGLRLHPPAHFVIPHGMLSDAVVDGYMVPKDAEVNFMVAEIGRDRKVWTRPQEFRPERFLEGGEGHDVDIKGIKEIKMMPFGIGRRMCPGYLLAMRMVEYFVARLVMELEWHPPALGVKVDMAEVFDFTTVMKHPLRALIVPRS
jgi:cytochrome P450